MSIKHQKKRNSLLIFEFLTSAISRALIEDDKKKSAAALKILRKHYKPGTNLYKEFRLMNALVKTTVSSEHVAASILKEAKAAACSVDVGALDREKSLLIRNINHVLNDDDFYDQQVDEYKTYATIQMLMNEWRSSNKDINKMAQYEDQLMKLLVTEKLSSRDHELSEESNGTSRLIMKVMTKKLNEKYGGLLNDKQKSIIKAYAFASASEDDASLRLKLTEIKNTVLETIDQYENEANEFLKKKLDETKTEICKETLENIDDATVMRFMLYSRLRDELESKE